MCGAVSTKEPAHFVASARVVKMLCGTPGGAIQKIAVTTPRAKAEGTTTPTPRTQRRIRSAFSRMWAVSFWRWIALGIAERVRSNKRTYAEPRLSSAVSSASTRFISSSVALTGGATHTIPAARCK